MVGRIGIGKRLQEGIVCHATPGRYIPSSSGIVCGDQQSLSWRKIVHGNHEFHDELTAAFFAKIKRLIGFRRDMFHYSGLSQKITVMLFTLLLSK
jgi:hypothetical protein